VSRTDVKSGVTALGLVAIFVSCDFVCLLGNLVSSGVGILFS